MEITLSMPLSEITAKTRLYIDSVSYDLLGPKSAHGTLTITQDSSFASGMIPNLIPGNYSVTILAFNQEDTIAMGQGNAEIKAGKTTNITITIHLMTGQLNINVIFDDESSPPDDDGLIAYYPFNLNTNDESSHGNNGFINGDVSFDSSLFGTCVNLKTVNSFVEIPDYSAFDFSNAKGFTIEGWVKIDSLSNGWIFNKMGPGYTEDDEWSVEIHKDGTIGGGIDGPYSAMNGPITYTVWASENPINTGSWNQIALVWDGENHKIRVYINGTLDNEIATNVSSIQNTSTSIQIGKPIHGSDGFVGWVDEVRIYNRALTGDEIEVLYQR